MMTSTIDRVRMGVWALLLLMTLEVRAQPSKPWEVSPLRAIHVSKDPSRKVPEIFVVGDRATTLRFETPCDPDRTKVLGGEGRFESLLMGNGTVVIVPRRDLEQEDRMVLLVTLRDGTEWPFALRTQLPAWDAQVNVFLDPDSSKAVRATLERTREENRALREENLRHEKEETSTDHAFAALLVRGQAPLTPFKESQKWALRDECLEADVIVMDGAGRTAVVLLMKNLGKELPWGLQEARLSTWTSSEARPFALRMVPTELAPGERGRLAVVMDSTVFKTQDGTDKLVLELFGKSGLRQAYVVLERRVINR